MNSVVLRKQCAVVKLKDNAVHAYGIYRSPTQATFVNVVAVNEEYQPLFVLYSDLTVSQAEEALAQIVKENV